MTQPNKSVNDLKNLQNPILRNSNNHQHPPIRLHYISPNVQKIHSEKLIIQDKSIEKDKHNQYHYKQQLTNLLRIPTSPNLNILPRSGSRDAINKNTQIGANSNKPYLKISFSNNPTKINQSNNNSHEKSQNKSNYLRSDTSREKLRQCNQTETLKKHYPYVLQKEFKTEQHHVDQKKIQIIISQADSNNQKTTDLYRPPMPISPKNNKNQIAKYQVTQNKNEMPTKLGYNNTQRENNKNMNVKFIFNPQKNENIPKHIYIPTNTNQFNHNFNQNKKIISEKKILPPNQYKIQLQFHQTLSNLSTDSQQLNSHLEQSQNRIQLSPRNHYISHNNPLAVNLQKVPLLGVGVNHPIINKQMQMNINFNKIKKENMTFQNLIHTKQVIQTKKLSKDDFFLGKKLGQGKYGDVYVVKHKITGFICALKIIPKKIIKQQKIELQFARQLKIQFYLNHQNITRLYNYFDDFQNVYLLLELCAQGHLFHLLKEKRRLSEDQASYMMKQICLGVQYMHNQRIIHRDLKPENIIMQFGVPKLCDFGWAVYLGTGTRHTFCGTPLYVSPEILKGEWYDQKIDLWSLGILCYELLLGRIPFKINTQNDLIKIVKQQIKFPEYIPISDVAKDFISNILKKNPQDRMDIIQLLDHQFIRKVKCQSQYMVQFRTLLV